MQTCFAKTKCVAHKKKKIAIISSSLAVSPKVLNNSVFSHSVDLQHSLLLLERNTCQII